MNGNSEMDSEAKIEGPYDKGMSVSFSKPKKLMLKHVLNLMVVFVELGGQSHHSVFQLCRCNNRGLISKL